MLVVSGSDCWGWNVGRVLAALGRLGVSPASFTQGVGTELGREVIGSETVALSQPAERPFFHHSVAGYESKLSVQSPRWTVGAGNTLRSVF